MTALGEWVTEWAWWQTALLGLAGITLLEWKTIRDKGRGLISGKGADASPAAPVEMSINTEKAHEGGFSYGRDLQSTSGLLHYLMGLRSTTDEAVRDAQVVIESADPVWRGIHFERPLQILNREGGSVDVPGGDTPSVFVCLAVQNAGTETPFITYANGDEELFCPTNRPYLKDTVLTLRVTGKANAPTRGKVRLSWRLLLLSWKIEDGS